MKARTFIKTIAASGTPEALTQHGVSTLTRSGQTVTVTTSAAHNYAVLDNVTLSGADQAEYNHTFQIVSVPTTTTFTFVLAYVSTLPATPATGTIVAIAQIGSSKTVISPGKTARTANTGNIYLGTSSANDTQPIALTAATDQLVIEPPSGQHFNLADWFADVATNGDGVIVVVWPRI